MSDPVDRPTLADLLVASSWRSYTLIPAMTEQITDQLHADGFTIPCDECHGDLDYSTEASPFGCTKCMRSGVLRVGIIDRPAVDVEALRRRLAIYIGNMVDHRHKSYDWCRIEADALIKKFGPEFGIIDGTPT